MKVKVRRVKSNLMPAGKRMIAKSRYHRGMLYLQAAALLQGHSGYSYVVGQLICQSREIILKALILLKDYDKYEPQLPYRPYGHNLVRLSEEASLLYNLPIMRKSLRQELEELNELYKSQFLRYGDARDFLVDPNTIKDTRVISRFRACLRVAEREMKKLP
jgi:hypothetical protein